MTPDEEISELIEAIRPEDETPDRGTIERLLALVGEHPRFARPVLAVMYNLEIEHDSREIHFACPRCGALRAIIRGTEAILLTMLEGPSRPRA